MAVFKVGFGVLDEKSNLRCIVSESIVSLECGNGDFVVEIDLLARDEYLDYLDGLVDEWESCPTPWFEENLADA